MSDEINLPQDLLYSKDYSWIKVEGDVAVLGLIAPAAKQVKEFVFIDLPKNGAAIQKGETYVSLEAVKWSGHLSSPVSGTIVDVNSSLFDEPSIINNDPYGAGWIAKVKLSNRQELRELMDAGKIMRQLKF